VFWYKFFFERNKLSKKFGTLRFKISEEFVLRAPERRISQDDMLYLLSEFGQNCETLALPLKKQLNLVNIP
jgi:hypothetical protein